MDKQLCVIMSLYKDDRLEYLKSATESILNQTYSDFDFYIQFDGIVKQECENYLHNLKDNRVKIFKRNENKGLACSLNDLLKIILFKNYKYVARMDADDISMPKRFEKQIDFLKKNRETDIIGGYILEIDKNGNSKNKHIKYPLTHEECFIFFKKRDPLAHPAVMFNKRFFLKAGFYSEEHRKNQDTILWFNGFLNDCIFANLNETVIKFRITDNLYKRRGNYKTAIKFFIDRIKINYHLKYNFDAYIYSFLYLLVSLSPVFIKKILYNKLR